MKHSPAALTSERVEARRKSDLVFPKSPVTSSDFPPQIKPLFSNSHSEILGSSTNSQQSAAVCPWCVQRNTSS